MSFRRVCPVHLATIECVDDMSGRLPCGHGCEDVASYYVVDDEDHVVARVWNCAHLGRARLRLRCPCCGMPNPSAWNRRVDVEWDRRVADGLPIRRRSA
jgi:hypothetical protein